MLSVRSEQMVSEALSLVQTPLYTAFNVHIKLSSVFRRAIIEEMAQDGVRVNREEGGGDNAIAMKIPF